MQPGPPRFKPWLKFVALHLVGPVLRKVYNVHAMNREVLDTVEAPFLIVANHTTFFDPVLTAAAARKPVQYIITDSLLQGILGRVIGWTGAIPLTKNLQDTGFLRALYAARDAGSIIGLFPEAQTSWDGTTGKMDSRTFKLVRQLGIPVIAAKVIGGYTIEPKWAAAKRKGRVDIHYSKIADARELAELTTGELERRIRDTLSHDDPAHNRETGRTASSSRRAEYLEKFAFICPRCKKPDGLVSRKNRLTCEKCGGAWVYSADAFLQPEVESENGLQVRSNGSEDIHPAEWNRMQNINLERLLADAGEGPLFEPDPVIVYRGYRKEKRRRFDRGLLSASKTGFHFEGGTGRIFFPYPQITGCAMVTAFFFEFYFDGILYEFRFPDPRANGLKYLRIMQTLNPSASELN